MRTALLKHACDDPGQYGLNVSAVDYVDQGVRLLRTTDLSSCGVAEGGVYVKGPIDSRFLIREGDILFTRSGATVGQAYHVRASDAGNSFAGYLIRFRPTTSSDARFVYYTTQSQPFQDQVSAEAVVSTIPNFNADRFANIEIPLPLLPDQQRIADFLDDQVRRIDSIIAARRRQLALYADRQQRALDDSIDYGGVRCSRLALFASIQSGITVDGGRVVEDGIEAPYLRVANVQAGSLNLQEIKTIRVPPSLRLRFLLRDGDVLMTEGGDLDKLGRGTVWRSEIPGAIHQNHVFAVRPRAGRLLPDYLAYVTASSSARAYFESTGNQTTNLASTSAAKVLDLPIPVRPVSAQHEVIAAIDKASSSHESLSNALRQSESLLEELKRSLITAAVTGDFDVSSASGSRVLA